MFRKRYRFILPAATLILVVASAGARAPMAHGVFWSEVLSLTGAAFAEIPLATTLVASGLSSPVFVTSPPSDSTRLFIVEAYSGRIKILELNTGALKPSPFLTQNGLLANGEAGLLGLAFHPRYPDSGYCYVNFTQAPNGESVIRRYTVSANPDLADTSTGVTMLTVPPNAGPNHNAGWLGFGPDGYLYVPMGDKLDATFTVSQNDSTRQGKILRLDVDGGFPYAIPRDNPYASEFSPKNEQWAKGLRNPWRASFDRLTGDLYVADVGQSTMEEINFAPSASTGGANYGWAIMEGTSTYPGCPPPCSADGLTLSVHSYAHGGPPRRCSITGGYVYRGDAIADLQGTYFFADFCSRQIWSLRVENGAATDVMDRTAELTPGNDLDLRAISSFGEDARGNLYMCDLADGEIFQIVASGTDVGDGTIAFPSLLRIDDVFPNPTSSGLSFRIEGVLGASQSIRVIDCAGRSVRALGRGGAEHGACTATLSWDGRNDGGVPVASGIYLLVVESGRMIASRKAFVLR